MYGRPGSRQQPGYACEGEFQLSTLAPRNDASTIVTVAMLMQHHHIECRKKKLRCDRQQPQCGTCANAGISCRVSKRATHRDPHKDSIKALRGRIGDLERKLSSLESSETTELEPVHSVEELDCRRDQFHLIDAAFFILALRDSSQLSSAAQHSLLSVMNG